MLGINRAMIGLAYMLFLVLFEIRNCPMMVSVILYSVCAIIAITSTVSGEEGGACKACNCQFSNVEVLDQLIESKIASGKLATTTVKPSRCQ